jgi:hypothetical protein
MSRQLQQQGAAKKSYQNPNTGAVGKQEMDILADGEPEEVGLDPVNDEARSQVVADALAGHDASHVEVKKYLVTKGGQVLVNGMRTTVKEGKVIDARNFDIAHLQRQGIRLQRYEEEQAEFVE